jgi:cell division protein FtsW
MDRVMSLFDPFADAQGKGYQISQSIYAIGSGKLFGLGLGQSVQKYSHLPEPYNDFIFSIVCEELGFFGGVIVIILFAALFLRAMRVAINAPDKWSSLTCIGIASQIGIQAFLNMGVAVSIIPNTGVSLPFFSYGGTSIMTLLFEMGILLNVSRKSIK